jgi:hypothetical protein
MLSIRNSLKTLYRMILRDVGLKNVGKYRSFFDEEIQRYSNISDIKQIEDVNVLVEEYILMLRHVKNENELLESYNINVRRDTKKKLENVAEYVGLRI